MVLTPVWLMCQSQQRARRHDGHTRASTARRRWRQWSGRCGLVYAPSRRGWPLGDDRPRHCSDTFTDAVMNHSERSDDQPGTLTPSWSPSEGQRRVTEPQMAGEGRTTTVITANMSGCHRTTRIGSRDHGVMDSAASALHPSATGLKTARLLHTNTLLRTPAGLHF